jgi:tetratricopeptide (TPR) repeat protein
VGGIFDRVHEKSIGVVVGDHMSFSAGYLRALTMFFIAFIITCHPCFEAGASPLPEAVQLLNMEKIASLDEMKAAIESLDKYCVQAIKEDKFTLSLQELILAKSKEAIDKLVSLHGNPDHETDLTREEEKRLFLTNREIIEKVLFAGKKALSDIQERLDNMEDSLAFFKTPEWQRPQNLAATSGYWLGWNGYYCSLLFSEKDPMKKTLLEEAIEGFSSSFINSDKDSLIVSSLFGRGLCYKEQKAYKDALKDFQSVREALKKEDLMYTRCRYQEALVYHQMGDQESALRHLDEIDKESAGKKIPAEIVLDLKKLRAATTVAVLEKKQENNVKETDSSETENRRIFTKLKELAANDIILSAELYRFTQKHAFSLQSLSRADLGPVASMAIADWQLDQKEYDKALDRYLELLAGSYSILKDQTDALQFHTAYVYYKKEVWGKAISLLETFHSRFPGSPFMKQAVSLYFAATAADCRNNSSEKTYRKFIDSAEVYLKQCTGCPDRSEAHFQVGDYYQQAGKDKEALAHFSQVGKDSPNYELARYRVAQSKVEELELHEKRGNKRSGTDAINYNNSAISSDEHEKTGTGQDSVADQKEIEPSAIILKARLTLSDPDNGCRKSLHILEGFETQFAGEKALFPEVMSIRIKCYTRLAMLKEAEKEIDRFINTGPLDSEQYSALHGLAGRLYDEAKVFQRKEGKSFTHRYAAAALMIYKRLYRISDRHSSEKQRASIRLEMARIYADEGEHEEALKLYKEILKDNPSSADTLYEMGLLYEKSGQWDEALNAWKRFTDSVKAGTQTWIESRYRTAYALKKLGRKDAACTIVTATLIVHKDEVSGQMRKQYMELQPEVCMEGR